MSNQTFVAWLGIPGAYDNSEDWELPCQNGQCAGTIPSAADLYTGEVTATWGVKCKLHIGTETVETVSTHDNEGNALIVLISREAYETHMNGKGHVSDYVYGSDVSDI